MLLLLPLAAMAQKAYKDDAKTDRKLLRHHSNGGNCLSLYHNSFIFFFLWMLVIPSFIMSTYTLSKVNSPALSFDVFLSSFDEPIPKPEFGLCTQESHPCAAGNSHFSWNKTCCGNLICNFEDAYNGLCLRSTSPPPLPTLPPPSPVPLLTIAHCQLRAWHLCHTVLQYWVWLRLQNWT